MTPPPPPPLLHILWVTEAEAAELDHPYSFSERPYLRKARVMMELDMEA